MDDTNEIVLIKNEVKRIIDETGLSRKEIAEKLNVSDRYLRYWLDIFDDRLPSFNKLFELNLLLDNSLNEDIVVDFGKNISIFMEKHNISQGKVLKESYFDKKTFKRIINSEGEMKIFVIKELIETFDRILQESKINDNFPFMKTVKSILCF